MIANRIKGCPESIELRVTDIMSALKHLLLFLASVTAIRGQCSVTVNDDLPSPQPLVLNPGTGAGFRLPNDGAGTLNFAVGETVRLFCVGTNNRLVNVNGTPQEATATCVGGKTFSISGQSIAFGSLSCSFLPWSNQRRSGKSCLGSSTDIELGFNLGDEFLTTINVCHDETELSTRYTKFTLVKEIAGFQTGFARSSWFQGVFFPGYTLATQYNRATQIATLGRILGSAELAATYIHTNSEYYFARGHITAKADFVYGIQHQTTFYYVNSLPQWQVFNGGNWATLETNVRSYASNTWQDLTVYTGVHGVTQLPDVNGVLQDLYFYADDNGNRAMPIPKFFWKILYNETTQLATAFVGVNDPYITELTSDYYLCEDISGKYNWLTWRPKSVALGISYACQVDELRKVITTIPSFTVRGTLD